MLTQSLNTSISSTKVAPVPFAKPDQFCGLTGHAGLVASEFSYRKDEEIYGEDEPAEYVYQVIRGAVRTYKLLSDGRRQIGAFLLPGDVFGLESGTSHRLAAEAVVDTTVRLVKRSSLEQAAGVNVQVARKLWGITAGELRHAENHMLLLGRKSAMERVANFLLEMDRRLADHRHDGAADVPPRYRRLSRVDARDGFAGTVAASWRRRAWVFRRPSDRAPQPPAPAEHGRLTAVHTSHSSRITQGTYLST